jgi:hypothetical protein
VRLRHSRLRTTNQRNGLSTYDNLTSKVPRASNRFYAWVRCASLMRVDAVERTFKPFDCQVNSFGSRK